MTPLLPFLTDLTAPAAPPATGGALLPAPASVAGGTGADFAVMVEAALLPPAELAAPAGEAAFLPAPPSPAPAALPAPAAPAVPVGTILPEAGGPLPGPPLAPPQNAAPATPAAPAAPGPAPSVAGPAALPERPAAVRAAPGVLLPRAIAPRLSVGEREVVLEASAAAPAGPGVLAVTAPVATLAAVRDPQGTGTGTGEAVSPAATTSAPIPAQDPARSATPVGDGPAAPAPAMPVTAEAIAGEMAVEPAPRDDREATAAVPGPVAVPVPVFAGTPPARETLIDAVAARPSRRAEAPVLRVMPAPVPPNAALPASAVREPDADVPPPSASVPPAGVLPAAGIMSDPSSPPAPAPVPAQAGASPAPVAAASPERAEPRPAPQIETAIAQVGDLREALRTARPELTLRHADFGVVSLRLEASGATPDTWRAVLGSRDPGFVPAIQAALAERAVTAAAAAMAASADGGAGGFAAGQNGTGEHRYGPSPSGGQGGSQPYLGQSGARDGEAAPDHRRPSTTAALAARAEEEAPGSPAAGQSGLFA